jgi:diguanylate cyclase (GGDEF)-like protein/PAS domain S-box-containing protein
MAHPLPNEKDLYERLRSPDITVTRDLCDCLFRRITEDTTAVILICQEWLDANEPMPVSCARKILLCTRDIENIMHTVAADSREEVVFRQFAGSLPLHPAIRELFAHQLGNDLSAINAVVGDYTDALDPRPIPPDDVRKISAHTDAIVDFIVAFKKAIADHMIGQDAPTAGDMYRLLFDSFSDGLVRFDMQGEIVECNDAFLKILGYGRDEIHNISSQQFCPQSWRTIQRDLESMGAEMPSPGFVEEFERLCVRKDGQIIPVLIKTWRIQNDQKQPAATWAIVRDISAARKEQRAVLREVWATQTVIEKIGEGITLSDETGHFEIFNSKMKELTGYTIDEANRSGDFNRLIYPDLSERNKTLEGISRVIAEHGYHEEESTITAKEGVRKTVLVTTSVIRYRDRDMFLSVWRDITAQRRAEAALLQQEEFAEQLVKGSSAPTFVLDREHKVISWNSACEALTGIESSSVIGTSDHWKGFYQYNRPTLADFVLDGRTDDLPLHYAVSGPSRFLSHGKHAEDWLVTSDGKERYVMFDAVPVLDTDGKIVAVIETLFDDTPHKLVERERQVLNAELVRSNDKLKELALKDSHTGLYNFRYLESAIESEFDRAKRQAQPLSVMMIDLDYFKSINDVYGHPFGDYILKVVAIRLRRIVRRYDTVIRYGGEEFVIICPGSDRLNTVHLAQRIIDEFGKRVLGNDEYSVRVKLSIGVASYPENSAVSGMALIDLADRILSKVKETGGNKAFSSTDAFYDKEHLFFDTNDVKSIKSKIERVNKRVNRIVLEELFAFARNSGIRDSYSSSQMEEGAALAVEIARNMQMPAYALELISEAAMIHDLGKLGLHEQILTKASSLSETEWVLVKQHPQISADILYGIPALRALVPVVLSHHERWDGTGYPNGLKGEEIPREALIISLVDAYSALRADRPYRKAYPAQEAISIIAAGSGTQFCPNVVQTFMKVVGHG